MHAGAAFRYIRDVLDEAHMPEDRLAAFRGAVMGSIGKLAKSEPHEAAALVLKRFPQEHASVVESLKDQPELQYKYLQAATQVSHGHVQILHARQHTDRRIHLTCVTYMHQHPYVSMIVRIAIRETRACASTPICM